MSSQNRSQIIKGIGYEFALIVLVMVLYQTPGLIAGQGVTRVKEIKANGEIVMERFEQPVVTNSPPNLDLYIDPDYVGSNANKQFPWTYSTTSNDTPIDFKLALLKLGIAKLIDFDHAEQKYKDAEMEAKNSGVGLWPPTSKPSPIGGNLKADQTSGSKTPNSWLIGFWAVVSFLGFGGIMELYHFFKALRESNNVIILFSGRPSTGKSWIWHRLKDPAISLYDLEKVGKTMGVEEGRFPPLIRGKHTLLPICKDISGHDVVTFVQETVENNSIFSHLQRWLLPKKYIWLVALATTPQNNVHFTSPIDQKIEAGFISEQFGFMDLIKGLIGSQRCSAPKAVIICIAKADLFLQKSPFEGGSDMAHQASIAGLRDRFRDHIAAVESVTAKSNANNSAPPRLHVIPLSAREGWGFNVLERRIDEAINKKDSSNVKEDSSNE